MTQTDGESPQVGLTEEQRVGHYIDMWKQSVEVQQHFNDIEWRIRGLALTVATFALGAAGLAVKDRTQVGPISLGAIITLVGLILWYTFYFVDRAWYHPLLKAAVEGGTRMEDEIRRSLPEAGLTGTITAGSPYEPSGLVRALSRTKDSMHSEDKLVWFYSIGAAALILVTIMLELSALLTGPSTTTPGQNVVVHVHNDGRVRGSGPGGH